jgi:hypothetical protein
MRIRIAGLRDYLGDGGEKVGNVGNLPLRFVGKTRQNVKMGPKMNSHDAGSK